MKTIKIKTFNMNSFLDTHHFFLLSKGYNAGKPLKEPCPNCFIVTANDMEHKYQLYWICYSLWKSGAYLPLLCGSVIPFLHIRDASAEIENAVRIVEANPKRLEEHTARLSRLMHTEKLLEIQLKLIDGIKVNIARRLIKGPQKEPLL